jgi:hypothetical protein
VCVEYANADSPKEDVLAQIQEHVTKKIRDNVPVVIDELDRKEAEEKYRKDNVNGQFIYEKRQPPASIVRGSARARAIKRTKWFRETRLA